MRCIVAIPVLLVPVAVLAQSGTGLTGQYYDTASFGALKTTRTDTTVNFNWGTAIPSGTAITSADTFSVAWSGQIEPEFTALYTFYVTADDGARLWINDVPVTMRTFYAATSQEMRGQARLTAGQKMNVRLEYIEQTGSASVKLEWSCASRAREVIPMARLYPTRVDKAGGSLLKEHWSGIAGGAISSLISHANYPNKPSGREFITSFECLAQDWADSHGTRVTGCIVPPATGSYTFAVSGDDVVELYLSTDSTAANKSLAASVASATAFRAWGAPSAARSLVQGQRYYVELLHKENTGSDHWSVGWMKPGDASFSVIPGSALVQAGLERAQPAQSALLDTMAQEHPRIFATAERFAKLKSAWLSATTSKPKTWAQNSINSANTILTQPAVTYSPDERGTILSQSRTVKDRMYHLGVAWWLTGDSQYAERAWTELDAVAATFPDWHPAHFLDTAEMSHAFAIGYDWFYNYWTQTRRDTIRNTLINKGLNVGLSQYTSNAWWSQSDANNWNCVCNGGLAFGSMAVGTENETLSEDILNRAINSMRPVLKHFTTDNGNWYEGPGYWGYTMEYAMRFMAGLEWVLGSDFALSATRNLAEAGNAVIYGNGSANIIFNYADASAGGPGRGPEFAWLARRYGDDKFAWWMNQSTSNGALPALWHQDSAASLVSALAPPDMAFHGETGTGFNPQEMVTMRGNWSDARTTFVGVKAGHMGADHGNLDAGAFVLDALGKRWLHDLGADSYALPGYFNSTPNASGTDRWDYYRMRGEGQNTLIINPGSGPDMVLNSVPPLIAHQTEPGGSGSFAIHDLTSAHSGMTRVWRGAWLMGARDEVLIQDEIVASTGKTVWWFAHYTYPTTTVIIDPDGTSAMLTQGAERLWCKIVSGGGTFQIMDAAPLPTSPNPSGQNANAGHKKLAINLTNVTNTTLAVWFVPLSTGEAVPATLPVITPLNTWNLADSDDTPVAANGNATLSGDNPVDIDLRAFVTDDTTPPEQMLFSVGSAVNGTVVLLADGYTARFTPNPGYTGVPSFQFTATDTAADPRMVLAYDFDLPAATDPSEVTDASGRGRNGLLETIGTGGASYIDAGTPGGPVVASRQGSRSIELFENGGANAARISRVLSTAEINWNSSDWTVVGWFKRRDSTNEDMIWHVHAGDGFGSGEELYSMLNGASNFTTHHYPGPDVNIAIAGPGTPNGAWHHFAVVRSGNQMLVFVDGALANSDSDFVLNINQTYPLVLGGHTDTTATYAPRWFDGQLDELAVFNAALSYAPENNEIARLAAGAPVRHFGGQSSTATISLSATSVTHNWTSTTSGDWSTGANWQSGVAPISSRGATVQIFNAQTLAGGTTVTPNNNLGGATQMNALVLGGSTTGTATVNVTGGPLHLLNNGTMLPTVALTASTSGLTYNVANNFTLGSDTTFAGTGSGKFIFNGNIDGPGGLRRTDNSSTLILAGTNTYQGPTTVAVNTLQIGNDGATGTLGSGDVIVDGTLRFDRTGTLTVPNTISGNGQVRIDCPAGAGAIELTGANDFASNVTIQSGALRITNSSALGSGTKTVVANQGTVGNPQLRLDGSANPIDLPAEISFQTSNNNAGAGAIINESGNNSIAGSITLTGGGGDTRILVSGGSLTLTGDIAPNTMSRNLRLLGAGVGTASGQIRNGNNSFVLISVTKGDSGAWTLAGANTHSGLTNIDAGTLIIAHPQALGSGGAQYGNTTGGTTISTAGGTLDLNGQQNVSEVFTLRGAGVGGNGALVNNSAAPASIAGGVITSISTTAGGTHSTAPNVTISGGGGSGATATTTLGLTAASFTIEGGTTVYSTAPTVTISGGGGVGATATAVLTGGVVSGITITYAGTGYTSAPSIAFSGGTVTTSGANPTGAGNASNFTVTAITLTNPGSGYISAPTVSFSSGTGTAATANRSSVNLASASSSGGSGDIQIDAPISGGNALTKVGAGTLTLTAANTYTGATTVSDGTLALSGTLTSAITNNATFALLGAPGTTGSFTQGAAGTLRVRLNPSSGDRLTTTASTLNGALELVCSPNLPPGSVFTILDNTSATAVSGAFIGKANNSTFTTAEGYTFRINYNLGTGNDVVLTLITTPIEQWRFTHFGSVLNAGSGLDSLDGDNDGSANLLEYATHMNPALSDTVPQAVARNGGVLEFIYTKSKAATDVTFIVEWSDVLSAPSWSTAGVSAPTVLSDNGVTQQIKVTAPADSGVTHRFVRLRITR